MRAAATIVELRQLLAERFPQAQRTKRAPHGAGAVATGVANLDALLCGGLPEGELSELVGDGCGSGSAQVIHALLRRVAGDGQFLAGLISLAVRIGEDTRNGKSEIPT